MFAFEKIVLQYQGFYLVKLGNAVKHAYMTLFWSLVID